MDRDRIQVELVKLADGRRVLRFLDADSALGVEKTVNNAQPLLAQKERLWRVFKAALEVASGE